MTFRTDDTIEQATIGESGYRKANTKRVMSVMGYFRSPCFARELLRTCVTGKR